MRQTVLCVFSCGQKGETNVPSSVEQQTAHIWTQQSHQRPTPCTGKSNVYKKGPEPYMNNMVTPDIPAL